MKKQLMLVIIAVLFTSGCAIECQNGMKPVSEVIKEEMDGTVTIEINNNNEATKKASGSTKRNRELTCKDSN